MTDFTPPLPHLPNPGDVIIAGVVLDGQVAVNWKRIGGDVAEIDLWATLLEKAEDALAAGLTLGSAHHAVDAAFSSLQADRMTAEEDGRPDPYPHLGPLE